MAIVSFGDARTRRFATGEHVPAFSGFSRTLERKLDQLEAAQSVADLAALPGNRLEALKGDLLHRFSIRINDQWRVCFRWPKGSLGPIDVSVIDYH